MKKIILITGSSGMLGRALKTVLKKKYKILETDSNKLNLLNYDQIKKFFLKNKIDIIIHLANKVFGILGNQNSKFEMINDNLLINSNLFKIATKHKIKKIISIGSSAGYCSKIKLLKEKDYLKFLPDQAEIYYGWSKRTMLLQLMAMKEQYRIDFKFIILNNLYGFYDNFDIKTGHVVPALIHKFYIAKKERKNVLVWKPKNAKRSFLFAVDAARGIEKIINSSENIINLGSKKYITIENLVKKISKIYNFKKKIIWTESKFYVTKKRSLSLNKISKLKFKEKYNLDFGLKKTIDWFIENYHNKNIRK